MINDKLKAMGLCVICKLSHNRGTNRCSKCTKKSVEQNRIRAELIKKRALCIRCNEPWIGKTVYCDKCKEQQNIKLRLKSESNRCVRCSEIKNDNRYSSCESCRLIMRRHTKKVRSNRIIEKKCVRCNNVMDVKNGMYCSICIYKNNASRWLGDGKLWKELRLLFELQNGKCAYTDKSIELSIDASIDHKIPRTRGGLNVIDNLQWVSWTVNRSKTDMTHTEFIDMCSKISKKFG